MSDGLRFIRFSVASPAEENRVGMLYPASQPSCDTSTLHPNVLAGEVLVHELILQGCTLTPGVTCNTELFPLPAQHMPEQMPQ